jgi:hypothetical protein
MNEKNNSRKQLKTNTNPSCNYYPLCSPVKKKRIYLPAKKQSVVALTGFL